MRKSSFVLAVLSMSLVFSGFGCAGGRNPDREAAEQIPTEQQISGTKVQVKDGSPTFLDDQVMGTGSLLFTSQLPDGGHNFKFAFSLADGGEVELVTFSDNELNNGVQFRFKRVGQGPGSLKTFISASGRTIDISAISAEGRAPTSLKDLDAADGPILFSIDVHNDESPAHVIIWNHLTEESGAGPLYSSEDDDAIPATPEFNGVPGRGAGKNWGLRLKDAIVNTASFGEAHDHQ